MSSSLEDEAATVQEAIDTIVQAFDYPQAFELTYTSEKGTKRSIIEISDGEPGMTYELRFDGGQEDTEPTLTTIQE